MPTNDLSDKRQILLNYIKELAKEKFPDADLSDRGAFMETFGTPHMEMLSPLLSFADRVKLTQSLENAHLMTEEEMDEFAAGHNTHRKPGEYARGFITLLFDDIPANNMIQVPAGTEAESKRGLRFRSAETVSLNENALANYYDPDSFRYRIPVLFEAENPGTAYNIEENDINQILTTLPHFDRAYNGLAFEGGEDREDNIALAQRIQNEGQTPNLGVERGWKKFINDFGVVNDVIVAGFGHPLMQRDVVGITPPGRFHENVPQEVHWGGKIDLHIRGRQLNTFLETKRIKKNDEGQLVVYLEKNPVHDVSEINFSSPRYTDPDLDESFFLVRDFFLMKDEDPETIGTIDETAWVVLMDDRLKEDDIVEIRYRYNYLFERINAALYNEDNRPPASDVLLKEARRKFVHSGLVVGMANVTGLQENDKSAIRQRLHNWFARHGTGNELQFSDLTQPIKDFGDSTVQSHVDYIDLPAQFIVTDHDNRLLYYCLGEEKRNFLEGLESHSQYFEKWLPLYRDTVTIYDFFDVLHILKYQNIENDAFTHLSNRNNEWGRRVHFFNMARRMMAYVDAVQRLSPAKWVTQENEYYELGHLALFENNPYEASEVETFINLFQNVASPAGSKEEDHHLLHLMVYFSVILYVLHSENFGGLTTRRLFDWMVDLTRGTPIDYQVHH